MKRASGIFLHPTSLPSRFGIGGFGENAYRWIDCLAGNRQRDWQVVGSDRPVRRFSLSEPLFVCREPAAHIAVRAP